MMLVICSFPNIFCDLRCSMRVRLLQLLCLLWAAARFVFLDCRSHRCLGGSNVDLAAVYTCGWKWLPFFFHRSDSLLDLFGWPEDCSHVCLFKTFLILSVTLGTNRRYAWECGLLFGSLWPWCSLTVDFPLPVAIYFEHRFVMLVFRLKLLWFGNPSHSLRHDSDDSIFLTRVMVG